MDSAPAPAASARRRSERHKADRTYVPPGQFGRLLCRLLCLGPSIVPMLPNASMIKPGRGTTNAAPNRILNLSTADPLARFHDRLSLPLIAAPMFLVSGVDLVVAACRNGVIGSFPTVNCRESEELDRWLAEIEDRLRRHSETSARPPAPVCP